MADKLLMHMIRDGIITGALSLTKQTCGNCNRACSCVQVTSIALPNGVEPHHRLIAYYRENRTLGAADTYRPHEFLGVGCGCYAKFHRQLAHIVDVRETRQALSE